MSIFDQDRWVRISAPMVRYSKNLVRKYSADLCYTPMIMADSFSQSEVARLNDFQTCFIDKPLVVQFGARNSFEFASAAELVAPFAAAVDLNCGCPQKWAIEEGIGAALLDQWELVVDMLDQACRRAMKPISVKIRVFEDPRHTVETVRRFEHAGAAWIAVHGRTAKQNSSDPVNRDLIRLIKQNVSIPVFANGNVFTFEDAEQLQKETGVCGVMAARGLLENPALFAGHKSTPWDCVEEFIKQSVFYGTSSHIFHHHLTRMTTSLLSPSEHRFLTGLSSVPAIIDFFQPLLNSNEKSKESGRC